MAVAVVDIGGTNTRAAQYILQKPIGDRIRNYVGYPTERTRPAKQILETACMAVDDALNGEEIEAIGIAFPGKINLKTGRIAKCGIVTSLNEFSVPPALQERYGRSFSLERKEKGIPLALCNDGIAFTIGEYHALAYKPSCVVGFVIGTGFGSGQIVNYRPHMGKNCAAGEYGAEPNGHEEGINDKVCSMTWFEESIGIDAKDLYHLVKEKQHPAGIRALRRFARNAAHGMTSALNAYAPDAVVLGGFGGKLADVFPYFKEDLIDELEKNPRRRYPMPDVFPAVLQHPNLVGMGILCEERLAFG